MFADYAACFKIFIKTGKVTSHKAAGLNFRRSSFQSVERTSISLKMGGGGGGGGGAECLENKLFYIREKVHM